jgi:Ion transport protein
MRSHLLHDDDNDANVTEDAYVFVEQANHDRCHPRTQQQSTSADSDPIRLEAGSYNKHSIRKETDTTRDEHHIASFSGAIVENELFQRTIIALIVVNSILMGIGTYGFVTDHDAVNEIFETLDTTFLCIFTVELGMQFLHYGVVGLFQDSWLTFDFWVIALSWAFSSLKVIRAFRIVRAARLITKVSELKNLILALGKAMTKLFAIAMLMVLVFYVFGVMFTQLFQTAYADGVTDTDYFSSLHQTFFTLFQLMTLDS